MPKTKFLVIKTIGDSLTEGSVREAVIGARIEMPNIFQYWLYAALKKELIDSEVWNLGIGGQTINQICDRFQQCVPADVIVSMGGTNDVWRYTDMLDDGATDIAEDIVEHYAKVIPEAEATQLESKNTGPLILINSVPPFGNVKAHSSKRHNMIKKVNQSIQDWIAEQNMPNLVYCDIYTAMSDDDGFARSELVIPDGVHFTPKGNQAVGECIASYVIEAVKSQKIVLS
jgi:lysophospholipase L1-like esterase